MKYRYFRKNWHLFGLDIGKINICGDILETRCHLEIMVFSSSWKRWITDASWDFVDETENGTEDIWWILEGQDYPRLWWELIEDNSIP